MFADTGEGTGGRCCQQNRRLELGQKGTGSPENVVSNYLSAFFSDDSAWLPGMDSNHELDKILKSHKEGWPHCDDCHPK